MSQLCNFTVCVSFKHKCIFSINAVKRVRSNGYVRYKDSDYMLLPHSVEARDVEAIIQLMTFSFFVITTDPPPRVKRRGRVWYACAHYGAAIAGSAFGLWPKGSPKC